MKEKKDTTEPEADPERDQRTVFAYQVSGFPYFPYISCSVYILLIIFVILLFFVQMPLKATERDVYEFFSKAGKVFETYYSSETFVYLFFLLL